DRTQVRRRRDGRLDLAVRDQTHQRGHSCDHDGAYYLEPRLHQHGLDRLLELTPALFVVAHVDEHADEHRDHVLQHDALRDDGAPGEHRYHPDDHDVGEEQDAHRLPERVLGVPPHLCAARYCTSASSCAALIKVP